MRALFSGRPRRHFGFGNELGSYRNQLHELTARIDGRLAQAVDDIEALRRRDLDPDEAIGRLGGHEDALDGDSNAMMEMMAPEELHGLHMEYEANLERALRGIVTVERGCGITRLRHRPPDDEEPHVYYKRGHANVTHARLRMAEIVEVLLTWEPGLPAEATVTTRMERQRDR
ncbi:MAG: hypothetical protein IT341_00140 [Chloroflexi bacterium]|nr:hypothetical protein [Chloroflexota bacterium]